MTKEQAISIKSYIQVFIAAMLIVFGVTFLMGNHGNHFTHMGAVSFIISGILIIIKENWEYRKRKHCKENL